MAANIVQLTQNQLMHLIIRSIDYMRADSAIGFLNFFLKV